MDNLEERALSLGISVHKTISVRLDKYDAIDSAKKILEFVKDSGVKRLSFEFEMDGYDGCVDILTAEGQVLKTDDELAEDIRRREKQLVVELEQKRKLLKKLKQELGETS